MAHANGDATNDRHTGSLTWYVAKLILQCRLSPDDPGPWTFDEQIRVIMAGNSEDAYQKALGFGRTAESHYLNADGVDVNWVFCGLSELDIIGPSIEDGTEVASQRSESANVGGFVREKDDLAVFWFERNRGKTAAALLDPEKA